MKLEIWRRSINDLNIKSTGRVVHDYGRIEKISRGDEVK